MWKINTNSLNWFAIALIYIAFFALIGLSVYLTKSEYPLWALILTPSLVDIPGGDKE